MLNEEDGQDCRKEANERRKKAIRLLEEAAKVRRGWQGHLNMRLRLSNDAKESSIADQRYRPAPGCILEIQDQHGQWVRLPFAIPGKASTKRSRLDDLLDLFDELRQKLNSTTDQKQ